MPREKIFARTGIEFLQFNTLYQLMRLVLSDSIQKEQASRLLTIPDLINYWLTGRQVCEFSIATTTQMLDARTGNWAHDMLTHLGIRTRILSEIVPAGTRLGEYQNIPVIAPACHDTGSAVAATQALTPSHAYISSGTWSLVGTEIDAPIITVEAIRANVANEGGGYGTIRLLKNTMGLWPLQQCRWVWAENGRDCDFPQLVQRISNRPIQRHGVTPTNDTWHSNSRLWPNVPEPVLQKPT